ncbi:hypothetical protein [Desulfocicer vacuolatum]|nr:hypothetical protein [Desulfocicer vacuolatum]
MKKQVLGNGCRVFTATTFSLPVGGRRYNTIGIMADKSTTVNICPPDNR